MPAPVPAPAARAAATLADVLGVLRLGSDATVGVARIAEALHATILHRIGIAGAPRGGRASGLTGGIYDAVRGVARLSGRGFAALSGSGLTQSASVPSSPARDAALAVLNGVWGDHLVATGNPLAIPMQWRRGGEVLASNRAGLAQQLPQATGHIAVLVHGLCMNDRQWLRDGHDHGAELAQTAGVTPVYLFYNSGRHVSENGRDLATALGALLAAWPVPVTDISLIGHSMGGLVLRSACHVAAQGDQPWLALVKRLVCLGTPHHGAPLERGGRVVDGLFGLSRYAAPFVRLGQVRSAGITDLRWGNVQDADWQGRDRFDQHHDDRQPTPLPAGVPTYLLAATTAAHASSRRSRWLGDGLVPLASAWGEHPHPTLALAVPADHRRLITAANHWDLLSHPQAGEALRDWFSR
ncbi:MAG: alpha/beta hydrolase [Rubrivivax sp.]|nr:alpha/beta hydrolase [Rubrivivax sp.]